MAPVESTMRMYLFYAFGVVAVLATAAVLGTAIPGPVALVVAFLLLLLAGVLAGLF